MSDLVEQLRDIAEELPSQIRRTYSSGETKELPNDLIEEAADEIERLGAQLASARKAVQDYLDGNYPNPRACRPSKCPHDQYWYEGCEECTDEHFRRALVSLTSAYRKEES